MYFITTKRMLEVCFSAHPNIQYRTEIFTVGSESYLFADSVKKRIAQFLFKLLYLHCYG